MVVQGGTPQEQIWCNDRTKELLQVGFTAPPATLEAMIANHGIVIGMATQLKQLRAENETKTRLLVEKTEQLDESKEWYYI